MISGWLGELVAALPVKERRVELAVSQIAGAAEDNEIEWFNLDDACGHEDFVRLRGAVSPAYRA